MHNSELEVILRSLSKKDFYKFGKFLRSPYHNSKKTLIDLFDLIKKYYPDFDSIQLKKEKIFGNLFPGKFYNDGTMRNILSDMKEQAVLFLSFEHFINDDRYIKLFRLANLRKLGLEKSYTHLYDKIMEDFERELIDGDFFYTKFMFYNEYNHFMLDYESKFKIEERFKNLFSMHASIVNSSLINLLCIYIQFTIIEKASKKHKFEYRYLKVIEGIYNDLVDGPGIPVYLKFIYNSFKVLQTDKKIYFDELMRIKDNEIDALNNYDKGNLYNTLLSICHGYMIKGNFKYLNTLFNIIKEYAEKKLYKEGSLDHIPEYAYMNILNVGLVAGKIDWTENFCKTHIGKVIAENRTTLELFSQAHIFYAKGQYGHALEKLAKISTKNFPQLNIFVYKYKIKALQLKIFYESNDFESFYLVSDSLKHFVANDNFTLIDNKSRILNFLHYSKKLLTLNTELNANRAYEISIIKKEVINNDMVTEKIWLLTRIKDMEKNINTFFPGIKYPAQA